MWQRLLFVPALAVAASASFVFWHWMGTPVSLPDVPGNRLQCLSYTPFEPKLIGYNPQGIVSAERIEADMAALATLTGCIRIYSALDPARDIVQAAQRHGIKVLLGAWIGGRSQARQNRQQIDQAIALATRYPDTVSAIVAGNEVLLRREMTGPQLASLIRSIKARSPVPVAYADVDHFIKVNPQVVAAIDLALIHILPYWNDPVAPGIEEVLPYVERRIAEFRALYPGAAIMIGETGWPSAGRRRGRAQPSLVNEARYVRMFASRAETLGLRYNLIEAIDQPWKRVPEGTVGGYWGVLDQFRVQKFPLSGPVSEWPRWRAAWAVSFALAAAVLLAGVRCRDFSWATWPGLTLLGLALGIGMPLQWHFVATTSQTLAGWSVRLAGMALGVGSAALLARRLCGFAWPGGCALAQCCRALGSANGGNRPARLGLTLVHTATLIAAAYVSINLALAPRHLDIPTVLFTLPAIAVAAAALADRTGVDRREEALLGVTIPVCGLLQFEESNPATWTWAAVCLLLGLSQWRAVLAECRRLWRATLKPRQPQQREQHAQR